MDTSQNLGMNVATMQSTAGDVLNANGAIAVSTARGMDQISGAGVGFLVMFLVTVFSVIVSAYLLHQLITLIKEGIKSNYELKGAIHAALNRKDEETQSYLQSHDGI